MGVRQAHNGPFPLVGNKTTLAAQNDVSPEEEEYAGTKHHNQRYDVAEKCPFVSGEPASVYVQDHRSFDLTSQFR